MKDHYGHDAGEVSDSCPGCDAEYIRGLAQATLRSFEKQVRQHKIKALRDAADDLLEQAGVLRYKADRLERGEE